MELTNLLDDQKLLPLLGRLQDCVRSELAAANGPAPCFLAVTPSQPPLGMLDCSKDGCGVVWISPLQVYPSRSFPLGEEGQIAGCAAPLVMQLEVGIARCEPKPKGREAQADPQAYFDSMRLMMSDMQAIRRALACCFPQRRPGDPLAPQVSLETWRPLEGLTGAVGGAWSAVIG